jgi:hypothetical protein
MKKMSKKEFLAIADELTEIETVDEYFTVYVRKTDEGTAFYKKYDIGEPSYYYMFTLNDSFNPISSNGGVQIYNETFNKG